MESLTEAKQKIEELETLMILMMAVFKLHNIDFEDELGLLLRKAEATSIAQQWMGG